MLSSFFSAQSLKSYEHFSDLGIDIALSQRVTAMLKNIDCHIPELGGQSFCVHPWFGAVHYIMFILSHNRQIVDGQTTDDSM